MSNIKKYSIYSIIVIILCFLFIRISPIHNILTFDVGQYLNIGRTLNSGKIIYKDVYDTKGPIWYLLCQLLVFISDSLTPWFCLVIIVSILNFILFDKIYSIFYEKTTLKTVLMIFVVFSSLEQFYFCNVSEYYTLPIQLLITYYLVKSIETDYKIKPFIIGILFGILFFIKFTLVIAVGILLIYTFIKKRFNVLQFILGGLSVVTIVVLYLLIQHNLIDYLEYCFAITTTHVHKVYNTSKIEMFMCVILFIVIPICEIYYSKSKYAIPFSISLIIIFILTQQDLYIISLFIYFPLLGISTKKNANALIIIFIIFGFIVNIYDIHEYKLKDVKYNKILDLLEDKNVFMNNLPRYYYNNHKILESKYIDYQADYNKWLAEMKTIIESEKYDYLVFEGKYFYEITKYDIIFNDNKTIILRRKDL